MPSSSRVHPFFHVSLLRPYQGDDPLKHFVPLDQIISLYRSPSLTINQTQKKNKHEERPPPPYPNNDSFPLSSTKPSDFSKTKHNSRSTLYLQSTKPLPPLSKSSSEPFTITRKERTDVSGETPLLSPQVKKAGQDKNIHSQSKTTNPNMPRPISQITPLPNNRT
jgi:hypothetical protein